ncbi:arsenical pump-driving ATPase [Candidatus Methylospira mobilis]|uniref:Arsenical pump-driving ATPase n=1 Tax=Candidatus Methylospira mobilis TaxID=1808979 RepID=A0A5Q0BHQ4_9GAMM|nr:arsenical pump-driving ATPase [Candidatus Methylospira mobilis]QFY41707.1 arsenical pump-driving ATPase [Candidatus Methylospira mobilis]
MGLPTLDTRYLFFTGKGGVGKTSLSCATGIALAESGKRVLVVSTDPASNLDEVLGVALSSTPTPIPEVAGLFALNIDSEVSARDYRERMVSPYRGILPPAAIQSMEEQFSGACAVEIAAFDEFSALIGHPEKTQDFDHVIFDTAPTGHTLRLLSLPSAWNGYIESSTSGASCLGPLAGLEKQRALYAATVAQLADARQTSVVLVSRADLSALHEAERASRELGELGILNQVLVINGLFQAATSADAIANAMTRRMNAALAAMQERLAALPRFETPFMPKSMVGIAALRALSQPEADTSLPSAISARPDLPSFNSLVNDLEKAGHGVIMTMGKGGVGKTTIAAAIATELAQRGHSVVLSTTDPAAHVAAAIENPVKGLSVSRIDPEAEVEKYRQEVLEKTANNLDANVREMLEEDLRSPCTEEIAVFRAFAKTVDAGKNAFVVLDTAPTGHTILLLDAAEAYHREVMRMQGDMPEAVRQLLPRLRDPDFTRVIIATLAEATPVHEAERLQNDLVRAGIQPYAWVINQSLLASGTRDPLLAERGRYEIPFVLKVARELSSRCVLIPWLAKPPIGSKGLAQITDSVT